MPGFSFDPGEGVGAYLSFLQARQPLQRFHIEHTGIIHRCSNEYPGKMRRAEKLGTLPRRSDILVRGIRTHIVIYIFIMQRIAPFIPLCYCQRKERVKDGVQRINEWDICLYPCIKERGFIRYSPHKEPAGRPAIGNSSFRGSPSPGLQRSSHINEIIEGIDFIQTPSLLIPRTTHFPAAARMDFRAEHAAVKETQARHAKSGIAAYAIRAVCRNKHRCHCRRRRRYCTPHSCCSFPGFFYSWVIKNIICHA